jgi:hypothetical protein
MPGLTSRERISAVFVVPFTFLSTYFLARVLLPLMSGTAVFGTRVATALFYAVPIVSSLAFCLAPFGFWPDEATTPGARAYLVATALPSAFGFSAAALHRIRTNAGVA